MHSFHPNEKKGCKEHMATCCLDRVGLARSLGIPGIPQPKDGTVIATSDPGCQLLGKQTDHSPSKDIWKEGNLTNAVGNTILSITRNFPKHSSPHSDTLCDVFLPSLDMRELCSEMVSGCPRSVHKEGLAWLFSYMTL